MLNFLTKHLGSRPSEEERCRHAAKTHHQMLMESHQLFCSMTSPNDRLARDVAMPCWMADCHNRNQHS